MLGETEKSSDVCRTASLSDRQVLLQFIAVINLISVSSASMHASVPEEDILAFYVIQQYTRN